MKDKQYVIKGQSPECTVHEWNGTGWSDEGKGKRYCENESHWLAREMNLDEFLDFVVWRDEVGSVVLR